MSGPKVVLLSGGVGGAKVALGLYRILPPDSLAVIVNTGDDFSHMGLRICPDLDTMHYTLGGVASEDRGWGRQDESWAFLETLAALGGESWFQLGDRDLAVHVLRSHRLSQGVRLSAVMAALAARLGIAAAIIPMSDDPVETRVATDAGELAFQDYFVRRRCAPRVHGFRYAGAEAAAAAPDALAALASPGLEAILIAPSNPYLSIDPILAVPGMRAALRAAPAPIVAITPMIAGTAVKGPTVKIMAELGVDPSAAAVADHYRGLIHAFLLDARDAALADRIDVPTRTADTLMVTLADREQVARAALALATQVADRKADR